MLESHHAWTVGCDRCRRRSRALRLADHFQWFTRAQEALLGKSLGRVELLVLELLLEAVPCRVVCGPFSVVLPVSVVKIRFPVISAEEGLDPSHD